MIRCGSVFVNHLYMTNDTQGILFGAWHKEDYVAYFMRNANYKVIYLKLTFITSITHCKYS